MVLKDTKSHITLVTSGACDQLKYLHSKFPMFNYTLLASDQQIVSISKKYFYCEISSNIKVSAGDSLEKISTQEKPSNLIILDSPNIDAGSTLAFPPKEFVENVKVLRDGLTNDGILVVNIGCRVEDMKKEIKEKFKTEFKIACCIESESKMGSLLFLSDRENLKEEILDAGKEVKARLGLSDGTLENLCFMLSAIH